MKWFKLGIVLIFGVLLYVTASYFSKGDVTYNHICVVDGIRIDDIDSYRFRSGYIEIEKDGVLSTYNADAVCHTIPNDTNTLSLLHNTNNDILIAIIIKMYLIFIIHEAMREDVDTVKKGVWLLIAPLTYASYIIRHLYAKE